MSFENQNFNQPECAAEEATQEVLNSFREGKWRKVLMQESIGGNAGFNKAGINAFIEKDTEKIIAFGNSQNLSKDITTNPNYTNALFTYNFGNSLTNLLKKFDLKPEFFEKVSAPGASEQALNNLKEALSLFNQEYAEEQKQEFQK